MACTQSGHASRAVPQVFAAAGLALFAPASALAAPPYVLTQVTQQGAYTSLNPNISINDTATIAFAATDLADNLSKVVTQSYCTGCAPQPVSFFGASRVFYGASINNAATPQVLSNDNYSGDTYSFLRGWSTASPGTFTQYGSIPNPEILLFTGFLGLADNGAAVDLVPVKTDSDNPGIALYSAAGSTPTILSYPHGTLVRPQIAKGTGDVVVNTGANLTDYAYPNWSSRTVTGTDTTYTSLGNSPGISNDGGVVAFFGNLSGAPQIVAEIAYPADSGSTPATMHTDEPVALQGDPVSGLGTLCSLAAAASSRISVYSRTGGKFLAATNLKPDPGIPEIFQYVSVAFPASAGPTCASPTSGLFSRDLLVQLKAMSAKAGAPYAFKILMRGPITPVTLSGQTIDAATPTTGFAVSDTIASLSSGDSTTPQADIKVPALAFTAQDSSGTVYAFRALRSCALPDAPSLPANTQVNPLWAHKEKMDGLYDIADSGCRMTSIANLLSFFQPKLTNLTPLVMNKILNETPFAYAGGKITFTGAGLQTLADGYDDGNVQVGAVRQLAAYISAPLDTYAVTERVSADGDTFNFPNGKNVSPIPGTQANSNNDGLSPLTDFMICNQTPVMVKVLNCGTVSGKTACTKHFVVAKDKELDQVATSGPPNASIGINDPGYVATNVNLIAPFNSTNKKNVVTVRTRLNRIIGVEAYVPSAIVTPGVAGRRASTAASGADRLYVTADGGVGPSPVLLHLTDPGARQIGVNGGVAYSEIPNAEYVDNSLANPTETTEEDSATEIEIGSPLDANGVFVSPNGSGTMPGSYTLDVFGIASGTYTLHVESFDSAGTITVATASVATVSGQHDVFTITRGAVGTAVTLIKN